MKNGAARRIDWLDILRGAAIVMVIIVHSDQFHPIHNRILNRFALEGMRGVQLFFVISGFTVLMTYEKGRDAVSFFIRRFFRIVPLYALFTVFWYVAAHGRKSYFAPEGFGPVDLIKTLAFVNIWDVRAYNAILPGGWSVSAEMNMYLIVPVLSSFLVTRGRGFALLAVSVVAGILLSWGGYLLFRNQPGSALTNAYFNSYWLPTCLPSFIAGMLAYRIYSTTEISRTVSLLLLVLSSVSFVVLCLIPIHLKSILCAPILGVLVLSFGNLGRGSEFPAFTTWIGKVSYSAYFWHFIVIFFLSEMHFHQPDGFLPAFALIAAATVALSSLTYAFLEVPFVRLGRRLTSKSKASVS